MARTAPFLFVLLLTLTTGCSAIEHKVGDMVETKLAEVVETAVDKKLNEHGLSVAILHSALDVQGDGKITTAGTVVAVKEVAKEYGLAEAQKLVDDRVAQAEQRISSGQDSALSKLWDKIIAGLGGLLSVYLGKQLVSARNDSKKHANYHARISVVEALLGKKLPDDETA